jgi:hypothetical protein
MRGSSLEVVFIIQNAEVDADDPIPDDDGDARAWTGNR